SPPVVRIDTRADRPGTRRTSTGMSVSRILTGTRCTTRTKLPVRRDQAEGSAAPRREAVDNTPHVPIGIAVDGHAYRLADTDVFELRFLEVGYDPDVPDGYDVEQGRSCAEEPAHTNLSVAYDPADRGVYRGVVEIDLSQGAGGLGLRKRRLCSISLGSEDIQFSALCLDGGLRGGD